MNSGSTLAVSLPVATWGGRELISAVIDLTRIQHYEQNPRQHANPEFDRIKMSIRTGGLDQPLIVTQRPGESDFLLHTGGNTRLKALNELFEESGEQRFSHVPCHIVPWQDETDVLLAHMRENELRGSLHFIDKARAVMTAHDLLCRNFGVTELSSRKLSHELHRYGLDLGYRVITDMSFAVNGLLPLIPRALSAGLSRRAVQRINALKHACRALWVQYLPEEEDEYPAVFATLCQRYDDVVWDDSNLMEALEYEIAERADLNSQLVRVALKAALSGRALPEIVLDPLPQKPNTPPPPGKAFSRDKDKRPTDRSAPSPPTNTEVGEISQLRCKAYELAYPLAQRNGLGDVIRALPDNGLGFLVTDVPDTDITDSLDEELRGQVSTLWWKLVAFSEVTSAPAEAIMEHLSEGTKLYQSLTTQDVSLLFQAVWTLDPGQTGLQLWCQLSDEDWSDLTALIATYRSLHQLSRNTGIPLWS